MARLIDADTLLETSDVFILHTKEYGSIEVIPVDSVGDAHTVDAVEVVRCRDCKFGVTPYGDEHDGWIECSNIHGRPLFSCNDFCSYGERKEGAD